MADEERVWLQKHTHESRTVVYGTGGTATYRLNLQRWGFLKDEDQFLITDKSQNSTSSSFATPLKLLSTLEVETTTSSHDQAETEPESAVRLRNSELTAVRALLESHPLPPTADVTATLGQRISIGSAIWLGSDQLGSRNLIVPITARVAGSACNRIQFACSGRKLFSFIDVNADVQQLEIPSLNGEPRAEWYATGPVEQVIFSTRNATDYCNSFLAVRQRSRTSIFEPLLRRSYSGTSIVENTLLDPNPLLQLDVSVTGAQKHADVAFSPSNQRQLALVDVQGNWSVWEIHGKRTRSARVLYNAQLRCYSKIFSWQYNKRPHGHESYYDGWHRIVWISENDIKYDWLLVCNRQTAKIYDLNGNELCSIDVRLDTRKADAYIVDVRPGPRPNLYFVLTTSKLLLFDLSPQNWINGGSGNSRLLLCSWQHYHSPQDLTLKVAHCRHGSNFICCLYSSSSPIFKIFQSNLNFEEEQLSCTSSDLRPVRLPVDKLTSPIAHVVLATVQTKRFESLQTHMPYLVQLVVQHEDLTMATFNAELQLCRENGQVYNQDHYQDYDLGLPPKRKMHYKSRRYVNDSDSYSDQGDFFSTDGLLQTEQGHHTEIAQKTSWHSSMEHLRSPKDFSLVSRRLREKSHSRLISRHADTTGVLQSLEQAMQTLTISNTKLRTALASELTNAFAIAADIDAISATIQQTLPTLSKQFHGEFDIRNTNDPITLAELYHPIFWQYIESLSREIPDRIRVLMERLIRQISLDLYLSNCLVRVLPSLPATIGESQPNMNSQPMVLSDPIREENMLGSDTVPLETSASQPALRSMSMTDELHASQSTPELMVSSLTAALDRLTTLTNVSNPSTRAMVEDQQLSHHIASLLAHLPEDADQNPNDYDWQSAELALAVERTVPLDQPKSRAQRKAEKLARVRERIETGMRPWETPLEKRADESYLQELGRLPVRTLATRPSMIPGPGTDKDNLQGLGSNPLVTRPSASRRSQASQKLIQTQPERGTFGTRGEASGDRQQKKKKRIAGF